MAKTGEIRQFRKPVKKRSVKPVRQTLTPASSDKTKRFLKPNRLKLLTVFVVIVLLLAVLGGRLTQINATSSDRYRRQVLSQLNYSSTIIPYRRGDITDRNGVVLATSEKVYNLILDPYVMLNSRVYKVGDCLEPTLEALKKYFRLNQDEIRAVVEENPENRYRVVLRQLTYDQILPYLNLMSSEDAKDQEVSRYIKGIWFEDDYKRKYPYNTLACDLIGYTVAGNVGNWGIEQYYSTTLNGTNGREYGYLTTDTSLERTTVSPVNGYNVVSTIDVNIQRIVEEQVWAYNEAIGGKNTAVIVMDPNNGEVLAMASYPVFNLNAPRDLSNYYDQEELDEMTDEEKMTLYNTLWRNFCISDPYEPGSTAKVMTVSAALDEATTSVENEYYCDGGEQFQDGRSFTYVKCNSVHGMMDLSHTLMYSCNDALMAIGYNLGKTAFVRSQEYFNLGQYTGIDLPGEASAEGLIYYENNMGPVELATNAFGQGYVCTAIQLAAAFCSVINGGYYYRPHVVKAITTEDGSIVEEIGSELMRTTVSEETSAWMRDTLWRTIGKYDEDGNLEHGTASDCYIEGYAIGGKTGTAEKKPLIEGKNTVSLISFAPADEIPQLVLYVVIDEPKTMEQGDSHLAQILSRKIYEQLLPYLQIFPAGSEPEAYEETEEEILQWQPEETEETEPELTGILAEDDPENVEAWQPPQAIGEGTVSEKNVWKHLTPQEKYRLQVEYLRNGANQLAP